jgi:hypothetical protein
VLTAVARSAPPALRLHVKHKPGVDDRVPARRGETVAAKGLPYAGPVVRSCLWCRQVLPSDSDHVYRAEEEDRCLLSWPPVNRSPAGRVPAASDGGQALCPGPVHRPRGV